MLPEELFRQFVLVFVGSMRLMMACGVADARELMPYA
jgi:hypothetical protein